jgi:predicted Zn-dependent protease
MKAAYLLAFALVVPATCAVAQQPSVDDMLSATSIARASQTTFSGETEYYLGRAVAARILSSFPVYENDRATQYVNFIGQVLVWFSDRPETYAGYHFLILDSDQINSFSTPSGFIFVTRGLLRRATSEDMVACALAYSISHVVMRSGLESIKQSRVSSALAEMATKNMKNDPKSELKDADPVLLQFFVQAAVEMVLKGLNQDQVVAADKMAIAIAHRAGYDATEYEKVIELLPSQPQDAEKETAFPKAEARLLAVRQQLKTSGIAPLESKRLEARKQRFLDALVGL